MLPPNTKVNVKVPASTANLGSGFDCIGVAFQLYTELDIYPSDKLEFHWRNDEGAIRAYPFLEDENLIFQAMKKVCLLLNKDLPDVKVIVQSNIPSTAGLGSSASAFIAGLAAINKWFGEPFSKDELLWIAAEREGHPDNVGASLFGGVFIGAIDWEAKKVHYSHFPFPSRWVWLAAIPAYSLATHKARQLLPEKYSKADVVFNLSRYGVLVSSLLTGNDEGVKSGLEDQLHQPYRQYLIPGFDQLVAEKTKMNTLGFVISGAGPTVLGLFASDTNLIESHRSMQEILNRHSDRFDVITLNVDQSGVQVTTVPLEQPSSLKV